MKDDTVRLNQVVASMNELAAQPVARDWSASLGNILNQLSVADKERISRGMHIGWGTSSKELRAYARACALAECLLKTPMETYANPARRITDLFTAWTGRSAEKLTKAQRSLALALVAPKTIRDGRFDYMRPLRAGASYSHADHIGPGTVGCFVRRGNDVFGLSNAHIMKHNAAGPKNAARVIVHPAAFVGGSFAHIVGAYAESQKDQRMDAALFRLAAGVGWSNITPDGRLITEHAVAEVGDKVSKYGFRTQRNVGTIDSLVNAGGYQDQWKVVGDVGFQSNGDSGSILVNARNQVVALMHMGGDNMNSGLATPIQRILDHFNVQIA